MEDNTKPEEVVEETAEEAEVFTTEELFEHLDGIEDAFIIVEPEPEPVVAKPKAKPVKEKTAHVSTSVPPTTYAVVGGGAKDDVYLSRAIYKNLRQKRSLTVHHIQRRLKEWGFRAAYSDLDGFYGDKTKKSVTEFQEHLGLEVTGMMDAETMTHLFEGDTNVTVHLS